MVKNDYSSFNISGIRWKFKYYIGEVNCIFISYKPLHYGSEQPDSGTSRITLSHELGRELTSERMSAAERASEASSAEKANE